MDRVAATLQRDGVKPREAIAICAFASNAYLVLFMGALRAGIAVAPLAPSSTPAQIAGMTADAGARHLFLDAANAQSGAGRTHRRPACSASGSTTRMATRGLSSMAGAGRLARAGGGDRSGVAVQHHLFVGHHGHAQGHRATALDALEPGPARRSRRLRPRRRHADRHAAVLQHHAGGGDPHAGARRRGGAACRSSTARRTSSSPRSTAPRTRCWCRCNTSD